MILKDRLMFVWPLSRTYESNLRPWRSGRRVSKISTGKYFAVRRFFGTFFAGVGFVSPN